MATERRAIAAQSAIWAKVDNDLDLHVLYCVGDADGPLSGEVKIGVSSRKAYPEELKALRTYRSAEIIVRFEAAIRGRARAKVVETAVRQRLKASGLERRGSWFRAGAELDGIVRLIAVQERVTLLSPDDVAAIEREAFEQETMRRALGG